MVLGSYRRGSSPLRWVVMTLVWLLPLGARAENRDPAEIGHAIWFIGMFLLFFGTVMSFAIWLLVVRLRSGPSSLPGTSAQYPSFEKVWSKDARVAADATPTADAENA